MDMLFGVSHEIIWKMQINMEKKGCKQVYLLKWEEQEAFVIEKGK